MVDTMRWERYLAAKGHVVAGVDEVGRGPLAGPVVAAAVILPQDVNLLGLKDSKVLSHKVRSRLYDEIREKASAIGIGKVGPLHIDRINIHHASLLAMSRAVLCLDTKAAYLLIDGKWSIYSLPSIHQRALIKGEDRSLSIAAASVIAKVTRDRIMERMALCYPQYGFEAHKGYPTREHIDALKRYGPSPIHRLSYRHVTEQQLSIF